ncbi:MAG: Unknown protein [uncultured Sulfurovum sp.]|uniref:Leucine-rich repeat protein n=1 Tax=uncultured Sulfurovum sp. TaxID=269237 RepID=A0A6S6T1W9_9BACT|nr:MAG: Unknown protein [uncultured Sulfurovum sp.]
MIVNKNYNELLDSFGSYGEYQDKFIALDRDKNDHKAWGKAKQLNSKNSYHTYLKNYYNGHYSNEAKVKVDEFIHLEKKKQLEEKKLKDIERAKEQKAWELVLNKNNKEDYENYLKFYPTGIHKQQAKININKIIKEEKQKFNDYNILLKYSNILVNNEFMLRKANNLDELKNTTNIYYKNSFSIPKAIDKFTKLKRLSIKYPFEGKVRVEVPLSIGKLIHLEELAISNCTSSVGLSIILPNFKKLKHLFLSHLSNFEFDNFSARLLPNLKSLNLTACDLYGLPVEIGASIKLERVDISNNNLIEIPDAFKYL